MAKFVDYQKLMVLMGKGLRTHFQVETSDFSSILEDQQRKYLSDMHLKKKTFLTSLIEQETWVQAKVAQKD